MKREKKMYYKVWILMILSLVLKCQKNRIIETKKMEGKRLDRNKKKKYIVWPSYERWKKKDLFIKQFDSRDNNY